MNFLSKYSFFRVWFILVQSQTSKYLRKKKVEEQIRHEGFSIDIDSTASSMFRKGINRRNMLKLRAIQLRTIESRELPTSPISGTFLVGRGNRVCGMGSAHHKRSLEK